MVGKKGGSGKGRGKAKVVSGRVSKTPPETKSLEEQGVNKELAKRARKATSKPADKFEADVKRAAALAKAAEGSKEAIEAARAEKHKNSRPSARSGKEDRRASEPVLKVRKFYSEAVSVSRQKHVLASKMQNIGPWK